MKVFQEALSDLTMARRCFTDLITGLLKTLIGNKRQHWAIWQEVLRAEALLGSHFQSSSKIEFSELGLWALGNYRPAIGSFPGFFISHFCLFCELWRFTVLCVLLRNEPIVSQALCYLFSYLIIRLLFDNSGDISSFPSNLAFFLVCIQLM